MDIIQAKDVSKAFGKKLIFNHMSASIETGGVIGLVGSNGSGKTTFIRMLSGLVSPDSGSLSVFGIKIASNTLLEIKQKISVLSDINRSLYWNISGKDNLNYFAVLKNGKYSTAEKTNIENLVHFFHMEKYINEKVETYSKGMKQKLLLVCAFLSNPPLLIMDEPMNGLDPSNTSILKSAIHTYVNDFGGTLLVTSHNQSFLDGVCQQQFEIKNYTLKKCTPDNPVTTMNITLRSDFNNIPKNPFLSENCSFFLLITLNELDKMSGK